MNKLTLDERYKAFLNYALDRAGEPSTWQGIGFLTGLLGGKGATDLDWGAAAALGGTISALIKSTLPDKL